MKAVKKFKGLLGPARAETPMQSILGQEHEIHFVEPPMEMDPDEGVSVPSVEHFNKSQSLNTHNRSAREREDVVKGFHPRRREPLPYPLPDNSDPISGYGAVSYKLARKDSGSIRSVKIRDDSIEDLPSLSPTAPLSRASSTTTKRSMEGTRGHARDPLEEECPFLSIGPSTFTGSTTTDTRSAEEPPMILGSEGLTTTIPSDEPDSMVEDYYPMVSESPGAAEFDIYETAYRKEVERIREQGVSLPKVFLTRRVDGKDELRKLVRETTMSEPAMGIGNRITVPSAQNFGSAVSMIRAQLEEQKKQQELDQGPASAQAPDTSIPLALSGGPEEPTISTSPTEVTAATTGTETPCSEDQGGKLRSLLSRAKRARSP